MRSVVGKALADLARALQSLRVGWYVFGAQAAIVYGSTRVTEDIDVTVDLRDRTARELVSALKKAGFSLRVRDANAFVERTRVLPLRHVATSMPVDVVLAGPGLEELFLARASKRKLGGRMVPVASAEDILVMKLLSGRPHDLEDARSMLGALGRNLDTRAVRATLGDVEAALGQSDLLPLFEKLRAETRRKSRTRR